MGRMITDCSIIPSDLICFCFRKLLTFINGGLIAPIIDCHSTGNGGSCSLSSRRLRNGHGAARALHCGVTACRVYAPTPLGVPLEVFGKIKKVKGRKVVVGATVSATGEICAKGEVVAVKMPEHFGR